MCKRSEVHMKEIEINTFIEEMEMIGDKWTLEQVKDVYGNVSLEETLKDRKSILDSFFRIIGKVL